MALSVSESPGMESGGGAATPNVNAEPSRVNSSRLRSGMSIPSPASAGRTTGDATGGALRRVTSAAW